MKILISILCCILSINASQRPYPVAIDSIRKIYPQNWYSGYLDYNFEIGIAHMHYFYFQPQIKTENNPVLFWFNGGPGCSSLLGALYQNGPFIFNDAFGFLVANPQAWNQNAHLVYIQSPAQVGFSYMNFTNSSGSYPEWTDQMVAQLNLQAVLEFFKVFPQLKSRQTYLSGESYAGIYVPTLAYKIHKYNSDIQQSINLKGFAVGNGCTNVDECQLLNSLNIDVLPPYTYKLLNDIGILNDSYYQQVLQKCKTYNSTQCTTQLENIDKMIDGVNIYDIYRTCWESGQNVSSMSFSKMLKQAHRIKDKEDNMLGTAPPCVDSFGINQFLNNKENKNALNITIDINYSMCTDNDHGFYYKRNISASYWVYKQLVPLNKYRIVKYSGDSDPAVPYSGSLNWINKLRNELRLTTIKYWSPWETSIKDGQQNSGSIWEFSKGFTFMRFKGVGHMVPQWNNKGGTKLVNYLLFGQKP